MVIVIVANSERDIVRNGNYYYIKIIPVVGNAKGITLMNLIGLLMLYSIYSSSYII
jgi:hypothetical protein